MASRDFPRTRTDPVIETKFGYSLVDPYRWLEQGNALEVRAWAMEQHHYTTERLRQSPHWEHIHDQLRQLREIGEVTVPEVAQTTQAYLKRLAHQNQSMLYIEEDDEVTVVHDPNQLTEPSAIDWFHLSPDARYLAYGVSQHGDEWSVLYVYDRVKHQRRAEAIPRARGASVAFDPEGRGFYYTRYPLLGQVPEDELHYYKKVYWHDWDTPYQDDRVIFEDSDPRAIPGVSLSDSGRYLLVELSKGWAENHVYVKEHHTDSSWIEVDPNTTGNAHPYWVEDQLFLHTNRRNQYWELVRLDPEHPTVFQTILEPHHSDTLYDVGFFQGHIVAHYLCAATSRLETFTITGQPEGAITLPPNSQVTGMSGTWRGPLTVFGVTGFDRPLATYTWSDYAANLHLDKSPNSTPIPIAVKQLWTESKDGTKIPYFLVHAKQWTSGAPTPTVVNGYGGFNVPMLPAYSPSVRRWVEEGGLYVMATLRGGSEFGETWHQGGMRAQKQNVFDDFEAVIMDVQRRGYTDPEHTAISGRSNGGLLVGATLTQRPDLIAAVVSGVPLLDMIRYPYFQIAALWTHEYGSPDNAEDFRTLLQYSPYHNVRSTINYPATLIFTSEEDSRVDPLHARKMVALLQNLPGQQRPIYLRVQSSAGHGVGKTVDQWVGEEADIWTFIKETLQG